MRVVRIFDNIEQVAEAAADLFVRSATTAIELRDVFSACLSGGTTPGQMYELLASPAYTKQLDWQKIHFFWGDERCVPPDDPLSNYRMANELLLDHIQIPPANIHRIHSEIPCDQAVREYEIELSRFFDTKKPSISKTTFDLLLLGLGEDGHTASLFPGSPALGIQNRLVVHVEHHTPPGPQIDRISLTMPAINRSRTVVFLVTGAGKAHIFARILEPHPDQPPLPAGMVQPNDGALVWLVDSKAADQLPENLFN
jgi:6-phosphogluconolactonase